MYTQYSIPTTQPVDSASQGPDPQCMPHAIMAKVNKEIPSVKKCSGKCVLILLLAIHKDACSKI